MTEKTIRSQDENRQVILAAINSLDYSAISTQRDFVLAVTKRSTSIASLLEEDSLPMQVLSAVKLRAIVKDVRFEESSNRYIITFLANNGKNDEQIRSPRMDSYYGKILKDTLTPELVGKTVIIYKINEERTDKPGQTVRVCPMIDVLG